MNTKYMIFWSAGQIWTYDYSGNNMIEYPEFNKLDFKVDTGDS